MTLLGTWCIVRGARALLVSKGKGSSVRALCACWGRFERAGGGGPGRLVAHTVVVVVYGTVAVAVPVTISTGPIPPQGLPSLFTMDRAQPPHGTW